MKLRYKEKNRRKSLLWLWAACILAAALVYALSGRFSPLNALFEAISGFTGTGATVAGDLSALPAWLLLLRAATQWLGGLLTIVTIFPILPWFEVPAHIKTRSYVLLYAAISAAEFVLLFVGGNGLFDSLTLTLTTISTGGFYSHPGGLAYYAPATQVLAHLFMLLGAASFPIMIFALRRDREKIARSIELKTFLGVLALGLVLGCAALGKKGVLYALSFLSTTGMTGVGSEVVWSGFAQTVLIALSFAGAATVSLGGGLGTGRIVITSKLLKRAFMRKLHPTAVRNVRMGGRSLPSETVNAATAFVFAYLLIFLAGSLLFSFGTEDFNTAATGCSGLLNNLGAYFDAGSLTNDFSAFPVFSRIVACLLMLLGRFRIFGFFLIGRRES